MVRFGMGAIKGVGAGAVAAIVEEKKRWKIQVDFLTTKRIDLRAIIKALEKAWLWPVGLIPFGNNSVAIFP
jgi:ribonuclease HI